MDFQHPEDKPMFRRVYEGYRQTHYSTLQAIAKSVAFFAILKLLINANRYIAVSDYTASFLARRGMTRERITVVGNGVDVAYINSIKANEKTYDGVFVGRIARDKGIFDLIEAWKDVVEGRRDAKLLIIGSGPDSSAVNHEITGSKTEGSIIAVGRCTDDEMCRLIKSSRVFVFPSRFEGWGMAVADALACGLPVVCYDIPAIREVFGSCKSVFLVPPGDVGKLASTFQSAFDGEPLRAVKHLKGLRQRF